MIETSWPGLAAALFLVALLSVFLPRSWPVGRRPRPTAVAPVLLLLLAVAGPRVDAGGEGRSVLVLDVSWSAGPGIPDPAAIAAEAGVDPDDATVLLFGERVVRRESPGGVDPDAARLAGRAGSDLAAALREAAREVGPGGTVVVATDGRVPADRARGPAAAVRARGADLRIVAWGRPRGGDARVDRLAVPGRLRPGERALALVEVSGPSGVRADLRVRVDGEVVDSRETVFPESGAAGHRFLLPPFSEGRHEVEARLGPVPGDPAPENDLRAAATWVAGARTALVVNAPDATPILDGAGFRVTGRPAGEVPDPAGHDLLVLRNVPVTDLPDGGRRVAAFVRAGGGLLVLGGPDAFGPGGYSGRPLESVLPLRSDPGDEGLLVVVLLDRSGTMSEPFRPGGPPKVAAAVSAARRLLDYLPPGARFLFAPFSDDLVGEAVVNNLSIDGGRSAAESAVAAVREAGGGTRLVPPLARARDAALSSEGRILVLLLTDGRIEGEDPDRVVEVADGLRAAGARVYALAVGGDADRELLVRVAGDEDRVLAVGEAGEVGAAFLRALLEVEGADRTRTGRFEVRPGPGADSPLPDSPGPVSGYVRTWPSSGAEVWLETAGGDPVVAGGRSGLGTSICISTDPLGAWAGDWDGGAVLAALANRAARPAEISGLRASIEVRDGVVRLVVHLPSSRAKLPAVVTGPGGPVELELLRNGPGSWSAVWPDPEPGAHVLVVRDGDRVHRSGFCAPWAAEFSGSGVDPEGIAALRAAAGGAAAPRRRGRSTGPALAGLALLLLLFDQILKMRGPFRR